MKLFEYKHSKQHFDVHCIQIIQTIETPFISTLKQFNGNVDLMANPNFSGIKKSRRFNENWAILSGRKI